MLWEDPGPYGSLLACWNLQGHGLLNQQKAGNRVTELQNVK